MKDYHANPGGFHLPENHHFFMTEMLETSIYMILDFCINATTDAASMSTLKYPLPRSEAKAFLQLGLEMMAFFIQFKDSKQAAGQPLNPQERYLIEKVYPATSKMISYLGGYLQQDHTAGDGQAELKAGLKLILKAFNGSVRRNE